jgi:hypothetical protein
VGVDEVAHRGRSRDAGHPAVVGRATSCLDPAADGFRDQRWQPRADHAVRAGGVSLPREQVGDLIGGQPPATRSDRQDQRLGRRPHRVVHGAIDDRGQPRIALEPSHIRRVRAPDREAGDQVVDRDLLDVDLPERRQQRTDVGQERAVGPDDQHPAAAQLLAVGVEQIRGTVQADRRLAGARRALDAHRLLQRGPDQHVLIRRDRRDDVAHRPDPGPLDLRGEDSAGRGVVLLPGGEPFVLERGEYAGRVTEPPAQRDVHRLAGGRAVERQRDVGPPVDDDHVAGPVADVAAADVELLAAALPVDPAEEQRDVGVVAQRLGPAGQLDLQVLRRYRVTGLRVECLHRGPHRG